MYPKHAEYRRFREKASAVCVKGCSLKERRRAFFQTGFVLFPFITDMLAAPKRHNSPARGKE